MPRPPFHLKKVGCRFLPALRCLGGGWRTGEKVGGDTSDVLHGGLGREARRGPHLVSLHGGRLPRHLAPGHLLGADPHVVVLPVVGDLEQGHPRADLHQEPVPAEDISSSLLAGEPLLAPVVGRQARLGGRVERLGGRVEGVGAVGRFG